MATFTWIPGYDSSAELTPRVRTNTYGDGYEQRIADGINNAMEVWSLNFADRTTTEATAILDFLKARNGVEVFDWTPPAGTAAKFVCRSWSRAFIGPNNITVYATFEQVPA